MIDIFYDMYIDIFRDSVFGILMGVLIWAATLFVAGMILWGALYLIDTVGLPIYKTDAKVVGKSHTAAFTTMIPITTGKVTTIIPQFHPESWYVSFESCDGDDSFSVGESFYDSVRDGMWFEVAYKSGRLSGGFYVTEIIRQRN